MVVDCDVSDVFGASLYSWKVKDVVRVYGFGAIDWLVVVFSLSV